MMMHVGYVHKLERIANENNIDRGALQFQIVDEETQTPIEDVDVQITYTADPMSPVEQVETNAEGQTENITLPAPPVEYSQEPGIEQPYAQYTATITAEGYENFSIDGIQMFSGQLSLQNVQLTRRTATQTSENIVIGANTLYGDYPEKIPENEVKPVGEPGEIVLSRVVIPETIVVHDGAPSDSTAKDYYVGYADYIKNVASSEIYATWPTETLKANILAIMSFTLNRVYTEWYRNQGYNFTITSSTAYDHKWIAGRNYFAQISQVVDELIDKYLSRPNVKQPILTQYCDGNRVTCPNWMSQWGSKYLGDQNYSAIEILRYYYGGNMYINAAERISGIPASWPGYNLDIGQSGQKVRQLQEQLNLIGEYYNAIPVLVLDGIYGEQTAQAVRTFQRVFHMPQTGIVDFPTWYRISDKYVRLSGIAELM